MPPITRKRAKDLASPPTPSSSLTSNPLSRPLSDLLADEHASEPIHSYQHITLDFSAPSPPTSPPASSGGSQPAVRIADTDYKYTSTLLASRVFASLEVMSGSPDIVSFGERARRKRTLRKLNRDIGRAAAKGRYSIAPGMFFGEANPNPFLVETAKLRNWPDCGNYSWKRAKRVMRDRMAQLALRRPVADSLTPLVQRPAAAKPEPLQEATKGLLSMLHYIDRSTGSANGNEALSAAIKKQVLDRSTSHQAESCGRSHKLTSLRKSGSPRKLAKRRFETTAQESSQSERKGQSSSQLPSLLTQNIPPGSKHNATVPKKMNKVGPSIENGDIAATSVPVHSSEATALGTDGPKIPRSSATILRPSPQSPHSQDVRRLSSHQAHDREQGWGSDELGRAGTLGPRETSQSYALAKSKRRLAESVPFPGAKKQKFRPSSPTSAPTLERKQRKERVILESPVTRDSSPENRKTVVEQGRGVHSSGRLLLEELKKLKNSTAPLSPKGNAAVTRDHQHGRSNESALEKLRAKALSSPSPAKSVLSSDGLKRSKSSTSSQKTNASELRDNKRSRSNESALEKLRAKQVSSSSSPAKASKSSNLSQETKAAASRERKRSRANDSVLDRLRAKQLSSSSPAKSVTSGDMGDEIAVASPRWRGHSGHSGHSEEVVGTTRRSSPAVGTDRQETRDKKLAADLIIDLTGDDE